MANVIKLENIDKFYGDRIKTQVLFDINLNIKQGSFTSIIGESGSGKSTLLNIIGTLDKPSSGNVLINNYNTKNMDKVALADLRNSTMGFIFQFHYLLPEFTAYENILLPYKMSHNSVTNKIKDRANEIIDLIGLNKVKNNMANNMSGGQQQRCAIARALINDPKIILADEPTGNLDSDTTKSVYSLLRDINEKMNTTFVVITHDRRIAEKADRIIDIKDGKINLDVTV